MATIRLNNLVNPRLVNTGNTDITSTPSKNIKSVFTDIHMDLQLQKVVGVGYSPKNSGDLKVDSDTEAVKNSIRNIFNTKKGEKLLSPEFGSSLDQFLFTNIDDFNANIIGNTILNNLQSYEPRIDVVKLTIMTDPDNNQYVISLVYRFLQINNQTPSNLIFNINGEGQLIF